VSFEYLRSTSILSINHLMFVFCPDAKGYTRGFEASIGYKKGYAAGEKLAREQAAAENAKAQQM
jgi:hypothetical protein